MDNTHFQSLGWLPIENRAFHVKLKMVHIINKRAPVYFKAYFLGVNVKLCNNTRQSWEWLEAVGIMFSPVITIPGFRHETKARNNHFWWLVMGKLTFWFHWNIEREMYFKATVRSFVYICYFGALYSLMSYRCRNYSEKLHTHVRLFAAVKQIAIFAEFRTHP